MRVVIYITKGVEMLGYLILLFTLVPIIELALLIKVGQYIGVMNTVTLVLATGVLGAILARSQGLRVLINMQRDLDAGIMPANPLFDGLMILFGGILLLTPGFITDGIGLLILLPYTRSLIKLWVRQKIKKAMDEGRTTTFIHYHRF